MTGGHGDHVRVAQRKEKIFHLLAGEDEDVLDALAFEAGDEEVENSRSTRRGHCLHDLPDLTGSIPNPAHRERFEGASDPANASAYR